MGRAATRSDACPGDATTLRRARGGRRLLAAALLLGATACASAPKPVEACLELTASPGLNTFEGQPHALSLSIFALESRDGFDEASPALLLSEPARVPGVVGPRLELVMAPSERRSFREALPPTTQSLGLVADYYRTSDDAPGDLKAVVRASCGVFRKPKLLLTQRNLLVP